jgi:hypothetical protein
MKMKKKKKKKSFSGRQCTDYRWSKQVIYYSEISRVVPTFPSVNPLTPELNPSAKRCLTKYVTGHFAS